MRCERRSGVQVPACGPMHGHHGNLRCPASIFARAQTIADPLLVSPDGGLDAAALIVARYRLPSDPTVLGVVLEMAVALCGIGRSRRARHRRGSGRHNNRSGRIALQDGTIDAVLIIGAIARERGQGPVQSLKLSISVEKFPGNSVQ